MNGDRRTVARPTLEAVAARAGVGRGTVSRVINGSPKVSEKARDAVLLAIDELGYVPNRAARTLVTNRTDTIALVVSESEQRVFDEPYFAGLIRGIGSALAETGLQLILSMAQNRNEHDRLEHYLTGQHVDGVLLTSVHGADPCPAGLRSWASRPFSVAGRWGSTPTATSTWTTGRGPAGDQIPARQGPEADRHHRRSPGHGRGRRPSRGIPRRPARDRADRARRLRRLLRGERLDGDARTARPPPRHGRRSSRPPTRWRSARCRCCGSAAARCRRTSR